MFKFLSRKKNKKNNENEKGLISNEQANNSNNNQKDKSKKISNNDVTKAAMTGAMAGGKNIGEMLKNIDTSGMSLKEKMGLKMLQRMPKKKQEEVMRQALNPEELHKNKDVVLKQIDEMVKAGQIDKGQAEAVKAQMGLR